MNPETVNTIINALAEKLGTVPSELWEVLLRQAKVSAVNDIFYLVVMILLSVYIYINYKQWVKDLKSPDTEIIAGIKLGIAGVFFVTFFVTLPFVLSDITVALLNPEYWALEQLLRALGR